MTGQGLRVLTAAVVLTGGVSVHGQQAATRPPATERFASRQNAATATVDVRQRFVGHWRLVKFESFDDKGSARDAGYAGGRIMYDRHGNMSAQLMRTDRKPVSQPSVEPERAAAYASYTAYYGKYTVDPSLSQVTHSVEGALNPNWVKTDLIRYYEFSPDGQQLKLSIRNAQGRVTGTLTWQLIH